MLTSLNEDPYFFLRRFLENLTYFTTELCSYYNVLREY